MELEDFNNFTPSQMSNKSCANFWRRQETFLQEAEKGRNEKESELKIRELQLKEARLQMERQKITIKETSDSGMSIELTCYYDENTRQKISELLSGARNTLPAPPTSTPSPKYPRRRRVLPLPLSQSPTVEELEYRRSRKLPTIDGLVRSRMLQRYKLEEDAGSSGGSGMSVD